MKRCQTSKPMPGPRGSLRFTDRALFMITSGVRAKLDARGKNSSKSGQVAPRPEIETWLGHRVRVSSEAETQHKNQEGPQVETTGLSFRRSCCPFCPNGANIGTNLGRKQVWAGEEKGVGMGVGGRRCG